MRGTYLGRVALVLALATSGLFTYWILKPALAPVVASFGLGAKAATPPAVPARVLRPRTQATDFQAGVMVLVYGNDPDFTHKAQQTLDRLAGLGVNSVGLVFPIYQTTARSTDIHADPARTPSQDRLTIFIQEAHKRGFAVMLRPLLDEGSLGVDGNWRGTIRPQPLDAWFQAYEALILSYARLAQQQRVEILDIGSELNTLEAAGAQWLRIINLIRGVFGGQLTYSSVIHNGYPTQFSQALDFLSVDAYPALEVPVDATTVQLEKAWGPWSDEFQQNRIASGKPLVISEVGTPSRVGSYLTPWTLKPGAPLDLEAQRRYYQASCGALKTTTAGLYWWYTTIGRSPAPLTDTGYDPTGKPAEHEIALCYGGR
jgi:hypothetical protein